MILDRTYFQGNLSLPNISYNDREGLGLIMQTVGESNLNYFIAKYEPECLKLILGEKLYANFMEGLSSDPINNIWTKLEDVLFWKVGEYRFSPVANYVYFYTLRSNRTKTTTGGEKLENDSFTSNVSNQHKLIEAWNDMCDKIQDVRVFLDQHWNDYRIYADECGFMREFKYINSFGI